MAMVESSGFRLSVEWFSGSEYARDMSNRNGTLEGYYVIRNIRKQLPGSPAPMLFERHKRVSVVIESESQNPTIDSRRIVKLAIVATDEPMRLGTLKRIYLWVALLGHVIANIAMVNRGEMTDGDSLVIAKLEAAESPDPIYHKGGRKKGENGPVPMDVGKRNAAQWEIPMYIRTDDLRTSPCHVVRVLAASAFQVLILCRKIRPPPWASSLALAVELLETAPTAKHTQSFADSETISAAPSTPHGVGYSSDSVIFLSRLPGQSGVPYTEQPSTKVYKFAPGERLFVCLKRVLTNLQQLSGGLVIPTSTTADERDASDYKKDQKDQMAGYSEAEASGFPEQRWKMIAPRTSVGSLWAAAQQDLGATDDSKASHEMVSAQPTTHSKRHHLSNGPNGIPTNLLTSPLQNC
ncbi:predicted protein [Postia placenta Mad-698-R]|nr:predicted protein [Postia placenta Mad-698-R]